MTTRESGSDAAATSSLPPEAGSEWSLEAVGIEKRFGRVTANDGLNIVLRQGEVHGLLGENGAGKSTFVKILAGVHRPDDGVISISGRPVTIDSPRRSRELGIAVVHQMSSLVPALTVAENTILLSDRVGRLDPSFNDRLRETASALGFEIDPRQRISRLSVGQRQRAEIIRALIHEARLVVLDEPTAVLAPQERDDLFGLLRTLAAKGTGVVLVTHRLDEALGECDRLTILRHGRVVGESDSPKELPEKELVSMLVGEVTTYARNARSTGGVVVEANGLVGCPPHGHHLRGVDLSVKAGEVLGIAGVEGNGQRELAAALVGSWVPDEGTVALSGRPIAEYPGRERREFIADIPDDDSLALIYDAPVWQNLVLDKLAWERAPTPWGRAGLRRSAARLIQEFEIKTGSLETQVRRLSGGNRRRVVLARELSKQPRLVVATYATKGLDVRSSEVVKQWIGRLADAGAAVVYIASELEELLDLSDRIAVLARGRITGILPASEADVADIGRLMLSDIRPEVAAA